MSKRGFSDGLKIVVGSLVVIGVIVGILIGLANLASQGACAISLLQIFEHQSGLLGDERDNIPCKLALDQATKEEMEEYAVAVIKEKTDRYPKISEQFLQEVQPNDQAVVLPKGGGLIIRATISGLAGGELLFYDRSGNLVRRESVPDCGEWRRYLRGSEVYKPRLDLPPNSKAVNVGRYTVYLAGHGQAVGIIDWWNHQTLVGDQRGVLLNLHAYPVLCEVAYNDLVNVQFANEQRHKR